MEEPDEELGYSKYNYQNSVPAVIVFFISIVILGATQLFIQSTFQNDDGHLLSKCLFVDFRFSCHNKISKLSNISYISLEILDFQSVIFFLIIQNINTVVKKKIKFITYPHTDIPANLNLLKAFIQKRFSIIDKSIFFIFYLTYFIEFKSKFIS